MVAIAAALLATAALQGATARAQDPPAGSHVLRGTLLRVIDAGHWHVRIGDHAESVRLVAVRPPPSGGPRGRCLIRRAREVVSRFVPIGREVELVTDPALPPRDTGGSILAWAYRPGQSGVSSLNRALVVTGAARFWTAPRRFLHGHALVEADRRARAADVGMWGPHCRYLTTRSLEERLADLGYLPGHAVDGERDDRTDHAVVAFQGWERLDRDGIAGPRTRARLFRAVRPAPSTGLRRGLEIHVDRQVLLVVRRGLVMRAIHVSTGAPGNRTPLGRFEVIRRERLDWSVPFDTWLPWALYFYGGYALHSYTYVPRWPASHGCVRLPRSEAPWVWRWAELGTPVHVTRRSRPR